MSPPSTLVQANAVIAGAFLSGAMMSHGITIPIYLDTNTDARHMLKQWARLYHYGHMLMPALCLLTTATYVSLAAVSARGQRKSYAIAGAVTVLMIPFTLLFMADTNHSLFSLLEGRESEMGSQILLLGHVQALLRRWAQLHFIRSCFPLWGAVIGFNAA